MSKILSKEVTAEDFNKTSKTPTADEPMNSPTAAVTQENISVVVADKKTITLHLKALDDCFKGIEKTFFKVAFNLWWFYDTGAYCEINGKGYDNIVAFAKDRYGLSKASIYNYINIVERFGKKDENGSITVLDSKWKDYSSTKLLYMLRMNNVTLDKCSPAMTVADIKKLLSQQDKIEDNTDSDSTDSDSADSTDSDSADNTDSKKKAVLRAKYDNLQELYSIRDVTALESRKEEIWHALKECLCQHDGIDCGISISMFW